VNWLPLSLPNVRHPGGTARSGADGNFLAVTDEGELVACYVVVSTWVQNSELWADLERPDYVIEEEPDVRDLVDSGASRERWIRLR
jgi:hypothetical protein